MTVFCPACRFHNAPTSGHMIGAGSGFGMSAGQLEATRELMELETELHDAEDRRVNEGYRFDYKPRFHAWCDRFTPSEAEVAKAVQGLMAGDDTKLLELEKSGHDVIIDAVNGTVRRVYALCLHKNQDGNCLAFEARPRETQS